MDEREKNRRVVPMDDEERRRYMARKQAMKRKRKIKRNIQLALIAVLSVALVAGILILKKYSPSKEPYDMNAYFGIEADNQIGVTVNNEVLEMPGILEDGQVYLPYETVRDYLNSRFYWDPNENILLYTLPRAMVRVEIGSDEYTVSRETKSEDYVILKTEGSTAYIALDFVQQHTNLEYEVYEGPGRVAITSKFGKVTTAVIKGDTEIRYRGGVKSPVLKEASKGDKVVVVEEADSWRKVRTEDGIVGYLKKSRLKNVKEEKTSREFEAEEFTSISSDKPVNLGWHQVTSQIANDSVLSTIADTKGLTVISPTWFSVSDNSGNISSIASSTYVNYAHQAGIDVWGLVDNFNTAVDSYELLSHTSARENMVNQLISAALQTGLDGINVDFEQLPTKAGEHYIQFIRELSVKCRLNDLVLSVDNYVPFGSINDHYHVKEQGVVADYVIIMGYDEHYSGSYEAGSVASYDYVKSGIETTLKDVPAEKVINAVPFYTRLWREVPKTEAELKAQEGTEAANYSTKVTSEALSMSEAQSRISGAGAEAKWDEKTKQYYAEWKGADGATYKIWLEEEKSLEEKLKLMNEYELAGVAAWKLGFEESEVWDLILKYVN